MAHPYQHDHEAYHAHFMPDEIILVVNHNRRIGEDLVSGQALSEWFQAVFNSDSGQLPSFEYPVIMRSDGDSFATILPVAGNDEQAQSLLYARIIQEGDISDLAV